MLGFLGVGRRWSGGLYFGPAGWTPAPLKLEDPAASTPADLPDSPAALARLLDRHNVRDTSPIIPSLLAQLRDLGDSPRKIRVLVLNLLPTQPESALPNALVRFAGQDLLAGFQLIARCVKPRRTLGVIDRHDFRARRAWRRLRRKTDIGSVKLLNTYPQSHHTLLLRTLFGKKVLPRSLPTRANRLVVDPVVCWALGRYARFGALPGERPVQVFLDAQRPQIALAPVGQTIAAFAAAQKIPLDSLQIIRNGMLAGEAATPDAPITWATDMLSFRPAPRPEPSSPCIHCGWCVDHCPTALTPIRLYELALLKRRPADAADAAFCVACGLCSYVCPTRLPLTEQIVILRLETTPPSRPPADPLETPDE